MNERTAVGEKEAKSPRVRRARSSASEGRALPVAEADFDERAYLSLYPDVAERVARGEAISGYRHYVAEGRREGRRATLKGERSGDVFVRLEATTGSPPGVGRLAHACDRLLVSSGGGVLLIGWANDAAAPLSHVSVIAGNWRLSFAGDSLIRSRRPDVEDALRSAAPYHYGYTGVYFVDAFVPVSSACRIVATFADGSETEVAVEAGRIDDGELRETILNHLAGMQFYGSATLELAKNFERGCGEQILRLNRRITRSLTASPYIERFGKPGAKPLGSLIVCLYGKAEYLFLQNALFSSGPGIEDYEFVFVSNSPELAETIARDARLAELAYGLDQTIVLLPGNAGFGAANNAAAQAARSRRVIAVNPDVFPKDQHWARKHADIVSASPAAQTKLFGAPLFYDDGSLMHGGMYFELDSGVSLQSGRVAALQLVRVEHYGKGAPASASQFTRPRPVPAVTGAFMSADRAWFEKLGGFTEDFVFGHYEDADLCLKSLAAGAPAWIHDLRLWHLEGKGSVRKPVHEGGSHVNRWLFLSRWAETLANGLVGKSPSHPLLQPPSSSISAPPARPPASNKSASDGVRPRRAKERGEARAQAMGDII